MAITISGQNNNDKILASDGVLDQISGFNVVGVLTTGSLDVTNFDANHINVGSSIQLGNAGIITATTLIGNVTGNVNSTSNLLFQISGSEKFRVGNGGQLGIGGANYGSSGQVLTSGGSGSAPTWSTISLDKITEGNTEAEVVDTGSDGHFKVTTEGSERLRILSNGNVLIGTTVDGNQALNVYGAANAAMVIQNSSTGTGANNGLYIGNGNSTISYIWNYENDSMRIATNNTERLRITSDGKFGFGTGSPDQTVHIHKGSAGSVSSTANTVLTLENSTTNVLQFLNPNNTAAQVRFGDPEDDGIGFIEYSHNANTMSFGVYGPTRMQLDSNGHMGIAVASATQLANSKQLTLRPSDDDGIRFVRPGDGNNSPNVHLDLTTTTSGSSLRSGGEAYTTKYHTYNCDMLFRSYLGGGTGGIIRFVTSDTDSGTQNFWQIDEDGMTTHRSRSSTVKTHEFSYTGGAGGGTLNVNLLSISGYSSNATCVVKTEYVGMYGLANSYISQGIWLCSYRRANGGSAANALAEQTHNGSNSSSSNVTIAWVGDNLRLTVGAFTGFTVHVTATVYNATINVLV